MAGMVFIISIPTGKNEILKRNPSKPILLPTPNGKHNSSYRQESEKIGSVNSSVQSAEFLSRIEEKNGFTYKENTPDNSYENNSEKPYSILLANGYDDVEKSRFIKLPNSEILKSPESVHSQISNSNATPPAANGKKIEEKHAEFHFHSTMATANLNENSTMEDVLRETLKDLNIVNSTWNFTNNDTCYQIMFSMESSIECENFIRSMNDWGIGEREGTSLSLIPCTFYHNPQADDIPSKTKDKRDTEKSSWNRFLTSITARLNVAQIVEEVKSEANITFDFLCLLIVAAILAAVGLVENSTIFLASSMLISPLMGPIIAGIFGFVIKDRRLQRLGVVNEIIGIGCATLVGFTFGLIQCCIDEKYGNGRGVTSEMAGRCDFRSLIIGIFTALPSGAAVAIAILGENVGSLVGVAISASLLPPAVNAGIMWSLSFVYTIFQSDDGRFNQMVNSTIYSEHQAIELAALGSVSMGLTIINILCIYIMGILFLKIKEVVPITSTNQKQFWRHDIKIARDYNKTLQSSDAAAMENKLSAELAAAGIQNTWTPLSRRRHTIMDGSPRPAMQDLESLFHNIATQSSRPITFRRQSILGKSLSPVKSSRTNLINFIQRHNDHDIMRHPSHPFDHHTLHNVVSTRSGSDFQSLERVVENINKRNQENIFEVSMEKVSEHPTDPLIPRVSSGAEMKKFFVTPADDDPLQEIVYLEKVEGERAR